MNASVPKSATPARNPMPVATATVGLRTSDSGRMGWGAARSTRARAIRHTAARAAAATLSSDNATSTSAIEVSSSSPPSQSTETRRVSGGSGNVRCTTTAAMRPIGRFTKKTQRHEIVSVMTPPTSGPTIDDTPHTLLKTACIRVRSSSV